MLLTNEDLLAISNIMDKKIKPIEHRMDNLELEMNSVKTELRSEIQEVKTELKSEIQDIKTKLEGEIRRIDLTIENKIQKNIDTLVEVFIPAAKRFNAVSPKIEAIEEDVAMIRKVMIKHSEKLQYIMI